MIKVTIHTHTALLQVGGSHKEIGDSTGEIVQNIDRPYREYLGNGTWQVRDPWRWAKVVPAIYNALEDHKRQYPLPF